MKLGLGTGDITPQISVELDGYGDRTHGSEGIRDSLKCYAVWITMDNGSPLLWLTIDVCILSVSTIRRIKEELNAHFGVAEDSVCLCATHTHSGPSVRFLSTNEDAWARAYWPVFIDGILTSVKSARAVLRQGSLRLRVGTASIGINRRDASLPVDKRLALLDLVDTESELFGVVITYGCHLTVLGVENYLISADWIGEARSGLEDSLGVPVAFFQGAEGDVDPRCRGVLEMADVNQAVGCGEGVLRDYAKHVVEQVLETRQHEPALELIEPKMRRTSVDLPLRYAALTEEEVQEVIGRWKRELARLLDVVPDDVPEDPSINARVKQRAQELSLSTDETREWVALQFQYSAFLNTYVNAGRDVDLVNGTRRVWAVVLDFGTLKILGVAGEPLTEVSLDWRRRVAPNHGFLLALCDGWTGYVPHRRNFEEEGADRRYETVSSMLADGAAEALLDAAEQLLETVE
jgi:hypothetical protein